MLHLHNVSFAYEDAPVDLFSGIDAAFPPGWTGVVGPNGGGKTTLLRLAAGVLSPHAGTVTRPRHVTLCEQRTDTPPEGLNAFLAARDPHGCRIRGQLRLGPDCHRRWDTLSHGERKRCQIGVALWRQPDALLLDEPTNHIDAVARALLEAALAAFRGIGVLVSHDRALLDSLCAQCVFVEPPAVRTRPGSYTEASAQARADDARAVADRAHARAALETLRRESQSRHNEAARADARRSKRHVARKDHDAKGKIDAARVSGADGTAGRLASQMDGRLRQAERRLADTVAPKERSLGIWMPGARSTRDAVLNRPAGTIDLGGGRSLTHGDLLVLPTDRIAVTGPNGSGKSTLVRLLMAAPNVSSDHLTYVPQEIGVAEARCIVADVRALNPAALGRVMTTVSCLGSRPDRLLATTEPSPGELRKLLLALGIARTPHLVVMDEPTNHLDLPAIECLEDALSECPCALLLVSHDVRFLERLTTAAWRLEPVEDPPGWSRLRVEP